MKYRGMAVMVLVVLCLGMSAVIAEEPANISLFNPETFQVQPVAPDETMLSLMNVSARSIYDTGSGTGEKVISITAEDANGNRTYSQIFIGGSDETSWSYASIIENQSEIYYTIIQLQISHASVIRSESSGIANESRDISRVYNRVNGDVSGFVMIQTLIPANGNPWLSGPVSIQQIPELTGRTMSLSNEACHLTPSGSDAMTTDQLQEILADDAARTCAENLSPDSVGNSLNTSLSSTFSSYGSTRESIAGMVVYDSGRLGNWYGLAGSSPENLLSSYSIDDLNGTEVYQGLRIDDSTDEPVPLPASSFLDGRGVSSGSYSGRIVDAGKSGELREEYSYSACEFLERGVSFTDGRTTLRDELSFPTEETSVIPVEFSGDHTLSWKDSAASLTGSTEASGPGISHSMTSQGTDSYAYGELNGGTRDTTSPVSMKGYVQSQVSSVSHGPAGVQSLYYVDAGRGVPVTWNTEAARGDEIVTSTGSSTSGSQFVRQKGYSDRSTLTAF